MVGYYGIGILPPPISYETYCALYFNLPRVRLQKTWDMKRALSLYHSKETTPLGVLDAQLIHPGLAEKVYREKWKETYKAQQKALLGWNR